MTAQLKFPYGDRSKFHIAVQMARMEKNARQLFDRLNNVSREDFADDDILQDAVLANVSRIAEASNSLIKIESQNGKTRIHDEHGLRAAFPHVNWAGLKHVANINRHDYYALDMNAIFTNVLMLLRGVRSMIFEIRSTYSDISNLMDEELKDMERNKAASCNYAAAQDDAKTKYIQDGDVFETFNIEKPQDNDNSTPKP